MKRDFGGRLTFWGGGCDTRYVLSHGTPEEVRQHVRGQVSILAPGGGFVFQQVHNILADVPPENIIAMFDAANEAVRKSGMRRRQPRKLSLPVVGLLVAALGGCCSASTRP